MFGFLSAAKHDPRYRQFYATCCQNHFENYGRLSTVFHSYEAVFLFALAADAGIVDPPAADTATCCKLTRRMRRNSLVGTETGRFLSAFAMLLGSIKLRDDVQDDSSVLAKIGSWTLRTPLRNAHDYFSELDADFSSKLDQILEKHQALESANPESVSLTQFQQATREGFGYLFGLFAGVFSNSEKQLDELEEIGNQLGAAIIAFDCAVDWEMDQRKGSFNPLRSREAANAALQACKSSLAGMCWHLRNLGIQQGVSVAVVQRTFQRIGKLKWQAAAPKPRGLAFRKLALRRGDCDCCCPFDACSGCDCSGAGDGASLCCQGPVTVPGCDVCCWSVDCCGCDSRSRRAGGSAGVTAGHTGPPMSFVGQAARTIGPLNPSGLVKLGEEDFPAVSENGDWIEPDTAVIIVGHDQLGLQVRVQPTQ